MDRFLWVINFFAINGFYVVRFLSYLCVCHSSVRQFMMSQPMSQASKQIILASKAASQAGTT